MSQCTLICSAIISCGSLALLTRVERAAMWQDILTITLTVRSPIILFQQKLAGMDLTIMPLWLVLAQ